MGQRGPKIRSLEIVCELFWTRVHKSSTCWLWTGARKSQMGYGAIWCRPRLLSAHRLSWYIKHGPIPRGMMVLHRCDNPLCIRPSHLYLGTHTENMADMSKRGRTDRTGRPGMKNGRAKLTDEQVQEIRTSNEPRSTLVKKFGITKCVVSQIILRKTWRHI